MFRSNKCVTNVRSDYFGVITFCKENSSVTYNELISNFFQKIQSLIRIKALLMNMLKRIVMRLYLLKVFSGGYLEERKEKNEKLEASLRGLIGHKSSEMLRYY